MNESPRILIVDNAAANLRVVSRVLQSVGYQVIEASTGKEGLRAAQEQSPDLILLDVALRDLDGVEVCRRIKADPVAARAFVVLLSSTKTDSESRANGIEAGADDYVARPVSNRELFARVQALLRIKSAEDALRRLSERYQATLAAMPDIIMEVDNAKVYTWANQAGLEFFGADVIGKEAAFYFEGDQDTYQIVQPLFNGKEDVIYVESWQRRHDGEKRLLAWWCRTLKDAQGKVTGALSTARDITEHTRAQAALKEYSERLEQMVQARTRELRVAQDQLLRQERLAVLGQIAGGISHELRSPLGAIKNALYLLKLAQPSPDPEMTEILQILEKQVANSEHVITSLMDFARPQPPHHRPTDVRDILDLALAQSALPENIVVRREFAETLPELQADPDQLQIVFGNLIRNAAQAMPEGGQLTIAAHAAEQEIEISFGDTGVGIAPELLDKIFQPMFTTKARGLGLGLALCKLLVEGHGGRIHVTSQIGKGTTFTIVLPMGD